MIPISASKFSPFPIFSKGKNLNKKLCDMLDRKNCFFFDRGASTLFVLLSILKRRSKRKKIIIPSYTADTVYIPAIQAGCEVKFCDMSLDSFNMDLRHLRKIVDKDTLAVIGVHLFGIPENMDEIEKIAEKHNVFVIDDFCQALGSKYKNKYAGSFGDASVLSFGKGKNLTAFDGGALFLDDDELIDEVNDIYKDLDKPSEIKKAFKIFGLSILSRPFWYGIFYRVLSRYRQVPAPEKIEVKKITKVQKNLISNLIDKKDKNLKQRALWGISLHGMLKDFDEIKAPGFGPDKHTVWNRFPLLVMDSNKREMIKNKLLKAGIESNFLYGRPVFDNYDIKVDRDEYKNSIFMASHLLTLPVNIFMKEKKLEKIRECFI